MKASKVFVLPSTREGFGIAALEAMACGLPVVTVDHPGNAAGDLVVEGVNGFSCGLSAGELGEGILFWLENGSEDRDMITRTARNYDWDKVTVQVEEHYSNLL